jgi:hypothetical protein
MGFRTLILAKIALTVGVVGGLMVAPVVAQPIDKTAPIKALVEASPDLSLFSTLPKSPLASQIYKGASSSGGQGSGTHNPTPQCKKDPNTGEWKCPNRDENGNSMCATGNCSGGSGTCSTGNCGGGSGGGGGIMGGGRGGGGGGGGLLGGLLGGGGGLGNIMQSALPMLMAMLMANGNQNKEPTPVSALPTLPPAPTSAPTPSPVVTPPVRPTQPVLPTPPCSTPGLPGKGHTSEAANSAANFDRLFPTIAITM